MGTTLPTGTGRYRSQATIGVGGFAVVVRAHDVDLDSTVALKILAEHWAADPAIRERFVEEARLLRRIRSDHVVALHDIGELDDGRPFFVMEFADRGSLADRLDAGVEPDNASLRRVVDALAAGVGALHDQGVIHRDINPRNLLLRSNDGQTDRSRSQVTTLRTGLMAPDERLLIGDLGIAKDVVGRGANASVVGGSPRYQAPEQLRADAQITPATDTYGATAVLWHAVTGNTPPLSDELAAAASSLHPSWREVLERGMSADPADRYPSIADWHRAVVGAIGGSSSATTVAPRPVTATVCPYKGLAAFQPEDAGLFFGRDALIQDLTDRLVGDRVLVVAGPSGSGKSSLVRAGLIPAIASGAIPGSEHWPLALMTPGSEPLAELAHQLTRHLVDAQASPGNGTDLDADPSQARRLAERVTDARGGLLLCIDQFEELFTLVGDPAARCAFVNALAAMADPTDSRVRVVLAVRADFYGSCAMHPWLAQRITANQVLVGPMGRTELRQAIELPAQAAGLQLEEGLIDRLLDDGGDEPGALPLVAHAMVETWRRRRGNALTLRGYLDAGGVAGAIAKSADTLYTNLDTGDRAAVERLFLRLVNPGEGTADTRRRVDWATAIAGEEEETLRPIIESLTEARLLTVGDRGVEVAHEALIHTWPRLRGWVDESREALRTRQRLERATAEWRAGDHDDFLLRGTRLATALEWSADHPDLVAQDVAEFLDASAAARDRREEQAARAVRRTRRLRRTAVAALAVFAAVAAVTSVVALTSSSRASRNENEANMRFAQTFAALAQQEAERSPRLAMAMAAESISRAESGDPAVQAYVALVTARTQAEEAPLVPATGAIDVGDALRVAMHPDGSLVATGARDGTIHIWDAANGDELAVLRTGHNKSVEELLFTPDGSTLISAGSDSQLLAWDVADPGQVSPPRLLLQSDGILWGATLSPDGARAAASSENGGVWIVDIASPDPNPTPFVNIGEDAVSVVFSPDGELLAIGAGSGRVGVWDVASAEPVVEPFFAHNSDIWEIEFAPDGATFATASSDGRIRLFTTADGAVIQDAFTGGADNRGLQILADGRTTVAGDETGAVRFWDLETETEIARLPAPHSQQVLDSAASADGTALATLSRDQTMRVWAEGQPGGFAVAGLDGEAFGAATSPAGDVVAVGTGAGSIVLADASNGQPLATINDAHASPVWALGFSPDGATLASGDESGEVRFWSVPSGDRIGTPVAAHADRIWGVEFTPDGGTLVSAAEDGVVAFWDTATGSPLGSVQVPNQAFGLAVSPDGGQAAVAGDNTVSLVDVRDRSLEGSPVQVDDNRLWDVAYSFDGELLAVASADEAVYVLETDGFETVASLTPQFGGATSVAFVESGTLATLARDGVLQLWDPLTATRLGPQLTAHVDESWSVVAAGPNDHVMTTSTDGTAVIWDLLDVDRACELAGGVFDSMEQRRLLGEGEPALGCADIAS